jgi:hypothetical protein
LVVIQRQLGHSNLGITSIYLQGIDNAEIIDTVCPCSANPDRAGHRPATPLSLKLDARRTAGSRALR